MRVAKRACGHVCPLFHLVHKLIQFTAAHRSPRKGERKPVYVLNLVIPVHHIDNCLEPSKSAIELDVGKPRFFLAPADLDCVRIKMS